MKYVLFSLFLIRTLTGANFAAGKAAFDKGDFSTALKEWQPLAETGLPLAAYNVGLMNARGQGVKKDFAEAAKWYRVAAEKGVPEAQYNLGILYSSGLGVPKDYQEAAKWFHKAADAGDVNAENNLGTLYDAGENGFKNYAEAAKWYRKAAEAGNANAQFNLGVMFDIGQGMKPDFAEADRWYRKAAEQWNEGALCNLAILYYNGEGEKRDLVQAHAFYLLAREAGDQRASNLMEMTTEKLNKKQIQRAEEIAAEFKRTHREQIAAAKNPKMRVPTEPGSGPEVAGMYSQPEAPASGGRSVWTGVKRVVAVGDVHGDYRQFTAVLRSAGLLDGSDNWAGGATHLVQTGDVVDEGPDSRRVMDLLIKLEQQARTAGGWVHCLIGNHEAMDVYGDLRFVSPAGFGEYRAADSGDTRDKNFTQYQKDRVMFVKTTLPEELSKSEWMMQHPLGFFEHRDSFAPDGVYGKWILSHDTVIRINDTLYSHAGISEKYGDMPLDALNDAVRKELTDPQHLQGGVVTDIQGPLWYTGLSRGGEGESVLPILKKFGAAREVVAHVDGATAIMPGYGNRVLFIDVGLSRARRDGAGLACLLEENGKLFALHQGTRLELPKDSGADMLRYLKQAAALDPEPSPLAPRISKLEGEIASK